MSTQKQMPQSGFKVINLVLMESSFKREQHVTFDDSQVEHTAEFDINVQTRDPQVVVTETLNYSHRVADTVELTAKIVMLGIFEKIGDSPIGLKEFGHVNGAAIIFPYIREHLTSMSAKAGLGMIVLPPMNFIRKESDLK